MLGNILLCLLSLQLRTLSRKMIPALESCFLKAGESNSAVHLLRLAFIFWSVEASAFVTSKMYGHPITEMEKAESSKLSLLESGRFSVMPCELFQNVPCKIVVWQGVSFDRSVVKIAQTWINKGQNRQQEELPGGMSASTHT